MSETTEIVLDAIDDIDGEIEVLEIVRNNPKVLTLVAIAGLTAGGVAGYFFAKKKLRDYYEDLASQEIEEAKLFYADLNRVTLDGDPLTPQEVFKRLHGEEAAEAVRQYQGVENEDMSHQHPDEVDEQDEAQLARTMASVKPPAPEEIQEEIDEINVFVDQTFDLEEEKKYRTPDAPYIITHDEYFAAEMDHMQLSLTYFETDDVLVDEKDRPVDNADVIVGNDHLARFGSGSRDKNVVYIRNEILESDFEITRSKGSYLEEVLGMPDDEPDSLKHSNRDVVLNRRREFRHGDG